MNCENCKCFYSCQIMQDRFGVKECDKQRKMVVNCRHWLELKGREELLRGIKK